MTAEERSQTELSCLGPGRNPSDLLGGKMKSAKLMGITAVAFLVALAIPVSLAARHNQDRNKNPQNHHYKLIDLGTFGGPVSYIANDPSGGGGASGILSPRGSVVGAADTSIPDPNYPNTCLVCPLDLLILHAFRWQDGILTDLGALPGVNSSFANWISPKGLVAGFSENSAIDPLLGVPEVDAVLWKDGEVGGKSLPSRTVHCTFENLRARLGWIARGGHAAVRIHDLRHTFICRSLLDCYHRNQLPDHIVDTLSTYVGHAKVTDTY
jgi:hypothetical protein